MIGSVLYRLPIVNDWFIIVLITYCWWSVHYWLPIVDDRFIIDYLLLMIGSLLYWLPIVGDRFCIDYLLLMKSEHRTRESGWRQSKMAEHESDVVASVAFFKAAFHGKTSNNKKRKTNSRTGIKRKGKKVEMHFKTENDIHGWRAVRKPTGCTAGCVYYLQLTSHPPGGCTTKLD